jgi:hypothetical protein
LGELLSAYDNNKKGGLSPLIAGSIAACALRRVFVDINSEDSPWRYMDIDLWYPSQEGKGIFDNHTPLVIQWHTLTEKECTPQELLNSFDLPCSKVAFRIYDCAVFASVRAIYAAISSVIYLPKELDFNRRTNCELVWKKFRFPINHTVMKNEVSEKVFMSKYSDLFLATYFYYEKGSHRLHSMWSDDDLTDEDVLELYSSSRILKDDGLDHQDIEDAIDRCKHKDDEHFGHSWEGRIAQQTPNKFPHFHNTARLQNRIEKYTARGYAFQYLEYRRITPKEWSILLGWSEKYFEEKDLL